MTESELTGRINRRGIFIASDGREAPAEHGRPWRASGGQHRVNVSVQLGPHAYFGIVHDAGSVKLFRRGAWRPNHGGSRHG